MLKTSCVHSVGVSPLYLLLASAPSFAKTFVCDLRIQATPTEGLCWAKITDKWWRQAVVQNTTFQGWWFFLMRTHTFLGGAEEGQHEFRMNDENEEEGKCQHRREMVKMNSHQDHRARNSRSQTRDFFLHVPCTPHLCTIISIFTAIFNLLLQFCRRKE